MRTPPRTRPPQWVFWVRRIVAMVLLVVLISLPVRCGKEEPTPAPEPPAVAPAALGQSQPLEMFIPSVGLRAQFEDGPCRVRADALDPATLDKACVYTASDKPYSLPGPEAEDLVVVAGHTGAGVHGVFDQLFDGSSDQHTIHVGDMLYLRTADSEAAGGKWLSYRATDLHDPVKEVMASDVDIWGDGPRPGRLLTISCIQPRNILADSVRNAVIGWQFASVLDAPPTDTGAK
ncbi:hypothetical protein [Corynebacterium pseudogenitalium]|uniref:hypothetical protein n=1 Tax=Corynebacterium pseudogenitalium TaxID=38303 RepID=UPI00210DFD64|nr:hypothetical protein [Corynebacterium pseudogenitalium]